MSLARLLGLPFGVMCSRVCSVRFPLPDLCPASLAVRSLLPLSFSPPAQVLPTSSSTSLTSQDFVPPCPFSALCIRELGLCTAVVLTPVGVHVSLRPSFLHSSPLCVFARPVPALAANEPQTEPQAAATEAHSPRSVPDENMDPHVASVMRMGAQTLDEALGYASTRDLLHLYGAVSDAVTDRLMILARDARPTPPDFRAPGPAGPADASGYHTPPSGFEPPSASAGPAGPPSAVPEPEGTHPMDGGAISTGPWSTREGWNVPVSLPNHICSLRRPDNWPYPDLFILHEQELPSWIPRQGVPEALKHLKVRGYCTYPGPKGHPRCTGLCLRPVLLGKDRAHTGHACFFCK